MLARMFPVILLTSGIIFALWGFAMVINPSSRWFRFMERACMGLVSLHLWNLLAAPLGLTLGINLTTIAAAGWLGLPGLAAMAAVRAMG
ncbi:MAG: pro-sigmaK processing inhibitor BofA family protein [Clostridia bacterium]|nr:pro-sigmaK processing inhibitor BofA family protein [Clostridia bacterium]